MKFASLVKIGKESQGMRVDRIIWKRQLSEVLVEFVELTRISTQVKLKARLMLEIKAEMDLRTIRKSIDLITKLLIWGDEDDPEWQKEADDVSNVDFSVYVARLQEMFLSLCDVDCSFSIPNYSNYAQIIKGPKPGSSEDYAFEGPRTQPGSPR